MKSKPRIRRFLLPFAVFMTMVVVLLATFSAVEAAAVDGGA